MRRRDRSTGRGGRQLASPFWRASVDEEVRAELAFHLEMTTRELMERGMTRSDAERAAAQRFGDVDAVSADCRRFGHDREQRERRTELWTELRQDAVFALRQLRRAPGFTTVVVLTLALGIGATAAVFSALYAVALRPLPFDHPERVTKLFSTSRGKYQGASPLEFGALRDRTRAFDHIAAAVLGSGYTFDQDGTPQEVSAGRVTADYFAVFGAHPERGRTFRSDEDVPNGPKVVVISHRMWVDRLHEDPNVVGHAIRLEGEAYTVIGVMPASFDVTRDGEDLWVPLALTRDELTRVGAHYLTLVGRLRRGITVDAARAEATSIVREALAKTSAFHGNPNEVGVQVTRFIDDLVGDYRRSLWILFGAVGFVLLIACTNVANLLLARGTARGRELAIRAALGAGHGRLVRQLLTESVVIAGAGVVVGLAFAYAMLRGILAVSPPDVPRLDQAGLDGHVLGFTLAAGVASSILFGLMPALRAATGALQQRLREGGRGLAGAHQERVRGALVAAQVALAMTLLTGAVLLIRSEWRMQHVDPGFDPSGVLTVRLLLPATRYTSAEQVVTTYQRIREEASHIPGVRSAALVSVVPLSGDNMNSSVEAKDHPAVPGHAPTANLRLTSPGYFATMGIPLLAGRDIATTDLAGSAPVTVINETLAHTLWPDLATREVVGKELRGPPNNASDAGWTTVVGVVGDVHDAALRTPPRPEFHVPVPQTSPTLWPYAQQSLVVVMRTMNPRANPRTLQRPFERALARIDPSLPLADVHSMPEYLAQSLQTARFSMLLFAVLAGIALSLAMIGVYGVVSYFVGQRTQEIGIRIAIGATPARVWQFVAQRAMRPILLGIAVGVALSLLTARLLAGQLFEIAPSDPATIMGVATLLAMISLLASQSPARRAMRVPPIVALED
jgi:putative ABC transport system permease protein